MQGRSSIPADPSSDFEPHRRQVYGWAYRLLGRHHDALDVCQDVFLRWWRQGNSATGEPGNTTSWLRRVTINRAIDVLRARPIALPPEFTDAAARPAAASQPTAHEEELRADVALALQSLTESQRSVLVAKVCDGLTFAQIADEQGISIPTAKTHYLRALAAVRDRLRRRWGPET